MEVSMVVSQSFSSFSSFKLLSGQNRDQEREGILLIGMQGRMQPVFS